MNIHILRRKLALSSANYKLDADVHRRIQNYNVGDYVYPRIRPERYPNRSF